MLGKKIVWLWALGKGSFHSNVIEKGLNGNSMLCMFCYILTLPCGGNKSMSVEFIALFFLPGVLL